MKTETEKKFDHLVSKIIWPEFKKDGYKKSGNNFRYFDDSGFGKIVNFQKSMYGNKNDIRFTVNIGVYLSDYEFYHSRTQSGNKFTEVKCAIRKRIGDLLNTRDKWYELTEETNTNRLYREIGNDFSGAVIPFLNRIQSKEDTIDLLAENSNYSPLTQIETLYHNGRQEQAFAVLDKEYGRAAERNNSRYKENLDKLKDKLK